MKKFELNKSNSDKAIIVGKDVLCRNCGGKIGEIDLSKNVIVQNISIRCHRCKALSKIEYDNVTGWQTEWEHKCRYCGEPNFSPDPDDLCQDCRETFGHTKYSEL